MIEIELFVKKKKKKKYVINGSINFSKTELLAIHIETFQVPQ